MVTVQAALRELVIRKVAGFVIHEAFRHGRAGVESTRNSSRKRTRSLFSVEQMGAKLRLPGHSSSA